MPCPRSSACTRGLPYVRRPRRCIAWKCTVRCTFSVDRAFLAPAPRVVARLRHLERPARHHNRVRVALPADERVSHRISLAKKTDASFLDLALFLQLCHLSSQPPDLRLLARQVGAPIDARTRLRGARKQQPPIAQQIGALDRLAVACRGTPRDVLSRTRCRSPPQRTAPEHVLRRQRCLPAGGEEPGHCGRGVQEEGAAAQLLIAARALRKRACTVSDVR